MAAYWIRHLVSSPLRAEEWVRSVECVPGSAGERYQRALLSGIPDLQRYAGYFDEIQRDLKRAQQIAVTMQAETPEHADKLLDADHMGRVLFQIGDRPEIDALTDLPEPSGEVVTLGPDHIEGPPGSAAPAVAAPEQEGDVEDITGGMSAVEEEEVREIAEAFDADQAPVEVPGVPLRVAITPDHEQLPGRNPQDGRIDTDKPVTPIIQPAPEPVLDLIDDDVVMGLESEDEPEPSQDELAQDVTQEILPEESAEEAADDAAIAARDSESLANLADMPPHVEVGARKLLPGEGEFPDMTIPEGSPD